MAAFLQTSDGTHHPIEDGMVIGRDAHAGIVISDAKASRRHARIISQGGVVEIEDLDSSNGTVLNGKPVEKRMLRDGDVIRIGTTSLTFHETVAAPPTEVGGFGAGDDLFDDSPPAPPAPPAARPPASPPAPVSTPEPEPEPDAPAASASFEPIVEVRKPAAEVPDPEVGEEILEFADDEVVLVKRTLPGTKPKSKPSREVAPTRDGGVLQFNKVDDKRSLAAQDFSQMSLPMRSLLTIVALAVAAGLFYVAMRLAS